MSTEPQDIERWDNELGCCQYNVTEGGVHTHGGPDCIWPGQAIMGLHAMSTHDDWRAAKERREDMAIRAARAILNDEPDMAKAYAIAYDVADTNLRRIGQELDGGA